MKLIGFYVKNRLLTICCLTTGHFSNKREWIALIQQSKFAVWFVRGARVHENATFDQVAMNISNHAAYISLSVWPAVHFCFFLADIDIPLHPGVVLEKISVINGINFPKPGTLDARMAKTKFSNGRIECKTIHTSPCCIDQHR